MGGGDIFSFLQDPIILRGKSGSGGPKITKYPNTARKLLTLDRIFFCDCPMFGERTFLSLTEEAALDSTAEPGSPFTLVARDPALGILTVNYAAIAK